jgi:hypothetical protein
MATLACQSNTFLISKMKGRNTRRMFSQVMNLRWLKRYLHEKRENILENSKW